MRNPRIAGLLFLLTGVLTLLGNTTDTLPPEAFWVGLICYPIGGYLFFRESRKAIGKVERRAARALDPKISNPAGRAYAEQQARAPVRTPASFQEGAAHSQAHAAQSRQIVEDEIVLDEADDDEAADTEAEFKVSSDVSFPLEIQERTSLAEQLDRLHRLQEQGIITAQEFAAAKAKLLK